MTCQELLDAFNASEFGSPEREALALEYNEKPCGGLLDPFDPAPQSGGGHPPQDPPRPA